MRRHTPPTYPPCVAMLHHTSPCSTHLSTMRRHVTPYVAMLHHSYTMRRHSYTIHTPCVAMLHHSYTMRHHTTPYYTVLKKLIFYPSTPPIWVIPYNSILPYASPFIHHASPCSTIHTPCVAMLHHSFTVYTPFIHHASPCYTILLHSFTLLIFLIFKFFLLSIFCKIYYGRFYR